MAKELRIIIAGTRTFLDYSRVERTVPKIIEALIKMYPNRIVSIITGAANGADKLGSRYAKEHHIPLREFPADWKAHGKAAGPIRNQEMLDFAMKETPALIVFWDGKSRGTKNMMEIAKKAGVKVAVVRYKEPV